MTALEYLQAAVRSCDLEVSTEFRSNSRGVVITPRAFEVSQDYGFKQRIMTYRVSLTLIGECVANGELFDTMAQLTAAFRKDQTAGGAGEQVLVDQWNSVEMDTNYTVFETQITIKE